VEYGGTGEQITLDFGQNTPYTSYLNWNWWQRMESSLLPICSPAERETPANRTSYQPSLVPIWGATGEWGHEADHQKDS
jgi:hypothetical protein